MINRTTTRILTAIAILVFLACLKQSLEVLPAWKGFAGQSDKSSDVGSDSPGSGLVGELTLLDQAKTVQPSGSTAAPTVDSIVHAALDVFYDVGKTASSTLLAAQTTTQVEAPVPTIDHDRIVVMGKTKDEDTSWVAEKLSDWNNAIYAVDDLEAPLHTSMNKGHEANPYLTYVIDHYDRLPSTIAFIHSHEKGWPQAWHTDAPAYSNVYSLQALNIDFVQRNGYANLRCNMIPGCPAEIVPFREPYEGDRTAEHAYAEVWANIFNNTNVPERVATPCCAQFAVSSAQVRKRPREFYVQALQFLRDTTLDDDTSGRVFEYMWHIMFGREPVYCPSVDQCYSDVYGRD